MAATPNNQGRPRNVYFGIQIVEFEKFIIAIFGIIGFLAFVFYQGSKYLITQDFNEQKHQSERACDNTVQELKTQIFILEKSKEFATKEDIEIYRTNVKKGAKDEK